jgi:hypothetical protein
LHFAPHALHYFDFGHLLHIRLDHAEPKTEIQAGQVQGAFGGPQAPSVMDANIAFGSRQATVHQTSALVFYFEALFYVLLDCALSI